MGTRSRSPICARSASGREPASPREQRSRPPRRRSTSGSASPPTSRGTSTRCRSCRPARARPRPSCRRSRRRSPCLSRSPRPRRPRLRSPTLRLRRRSSSLRRSRLWRPRSRRRPPCRAFRSLPSRPRRGPASSSARGRRRSSDLLLRGRSRLTLVLRSGGRVRPRCASRLGPRRRSRPLSSVAPSPPTRFRVLPVTAARGGSPSCSRASRRCSCCRSSQCSFV